MTIILEKLEDYFGVYNKLLILKDIKMPEWFTKNKHYNKNFKSNIFFEPKSSYFLNEKLFENNAHIMVVPEIHVYNPKLRKVYFIELNQFWWINPMVEYKLVCEEI